MADVAGTAGGAGWTVALNGARTGADGAAVPLSPAGLVSAAEAVLDVFAAAGAVGPGAPVALEVSPRTPCGRQSLSPRVVGPVVAALRASRVVAGRPGVALVVPVSVATEPDPGSRLRRFGGWEQLPDRVAVRFDEPGAAALTVAAAGLGLGVDAHIPPIPGRRADRRGRSALGRALVWAGRVPGVRIVCEWPSTGGGAPTGPVTAARRPCPDPPVPVTVFGRDGAAWPALRAALRSGAGARIGIGDVLTLPDGRPAPDSAALVRAALFPGSDPRGVRAGSR
ncbi:3-keto-5-aminohexanoate cleavage protein [Streptomyces sp. BI20]|uniref:3-keto-5-aminohexanoate cleavage protein n=1 Tax=Streptomyces sp. BI20 TaxID=3403460 RepID=UPI003C79304E